MNYMHHRILLTGMLWVFFALWAPAHSAEIIGRETMISRDMGGITITLGLTKAAPFRVFTLDNPRRLLIDTGEIDLNNMPAGLASGIPEIEAVRFGLFQIGESRIVLDLAAPLVVLSAQAVRGPQNNPQIIIRLAKASAATFASSSAPQQENLWQGDQTAPLVEGVVSLPLIAIDAGHGGVDQGAAVGEILEKDVSLLMAQALRDTLLKAGGFSVVMTRDSDVFIPLGERVEIARRAGASVFISLHADVVTHGRARGTTVFSLSEAGADQEAKTIATLENRADLVAGISVEGEDDLITQVLLQMAHRETDALSNRLADIVAETLWFQNTSETKSRRMAAGFRVLRAPDIPSILIEVGFLSDETELENMQDPAWRLAMSETLRTALEKWQSAEAEMRGLLRN